MSYLDIIKELEERLSGDGKPHGNTREPDTHPSEGGKFRFGPNTDCEKSELSEKSLPAPRGSLVETTAKLPPLGAKRGVLTLADLPELERRLRLSGWKVDRVAGKYGPELVCWTGKKPRFQ